jgi:hypothetical protein
MPSKPRAKSLGDLLQQAKADAPPAPRRPADEAPPLVVRSVALTPAAQATLEQLIAQASTAIGRKASASAVVRALLQWAEQEHLGDELVRLIAAEVQTGEVVWGKARGRRYKPRHSFLSAGAE